MQENEIIDRIKSLCAQRSWTSYRLAKESGITYSTLCTMLHKANAPSIPTLIKICSGLGISLSEFFDEDATPLALTEEEQEHLRQWSRLTNENQATVRKYMAYLISDQDNAQKD